MCNLYLIWCNQRFWKSTISCWKFSRKSLKHSSPATPLVAGNQCFRHADFIAASGIGLRVVPVHLQSYVSTNPTTLYRTRYAHDFVVFCFGPVKLLWFVSLCELFSLNPGNMMASSNGNIFRVTGPLCGEFTGHRWIPRTKASDVEPYKYDDVTCRHDVSYHWEIDCLLNNLFRLT